MTKVHKHTPIIQLLKAFTTIIIATAVLLFLYYFFNEQAVLVKIIIVAAVFIGWTTFYNLIDRMLGYKNTRYKITEKAIYIQDGGWFKNKTTIPVKRIQNIAIQQDFHSKFFSLYQLTVYTAGGSRSILYIPESTATELREKVLVWLGKELESNE